MCGIMQDMDAPSVATQATLADTDAADGNVPHNLVPCADVYALGDCAGYVDGPLPALAQVRTAVTIHIYLPVVTDFFLENAAVCCVKCGWFAGR